MLIAECGNNHFGDMNAAKELIRAAKDSGAEAVKFQAFAPGDFKGSMPDSFYEQCALRFDQYMELIGIGKYLRIPVFFSTFNNEMLQLDNFTEYVKLAAWQTNEYSDDVLMEIDADHVIVSINQYRKTLPPLHHSMILYATDYNCKDPILQSLAILQRFYKRPIGLSDHTEGITTCMEAIDLYEVPVIEKHFTLHRNMSYEGQVFRDTVHAADPNEFSQLARYFKKKRQTYKGGNHAVHSMQ